MITKLFFESIGLHHTDYIKVIKTLLPHTLRISLFETVIFIMNLYQFSGRSITSGNRRLRKNIVNQRLVAIGMLQSKLNLTTLY